MLRLLMCLTVVFSFTLPCLGALEFYPIDDVAGLPEIDDGSGPLKFDFSQHKIASRYDGETCRFVVYRSPQKDLMEEIGAGLFTVQTGKLAFFDSNWRTGGLATPESYDRANLALTEDGELIGRLPVYDQFYNDGAVPPDASLVTLRPGRGKLGNDQPVGSVDIDINRDLRGAFAVTGCKNAGEEGPIRPYFDFSKIKLASSYDNLTCGFEVNRAQDHVEKVGAGLFDIEGGHFRFHDSDWFVGGSLAPQDKFQSANLAISAKRELVGVFNMFHLWVGDGTEEYDPPLVTFRAGAGGKFEKNYPTGMIEFQVDEQTKGQFLVRGCKDKSDPGPIRPFFDFSKFQLAAELDEWKCVLLMRRENPDGSDEPLGSANVEIKKGRMIFTGGRWETGGPNESFELANMAITSDHGLVGTMDIHALYPDPEPHQPFTVTLKGKDGNLGEKLDEPVSFDLDGHMKAVFKLNACYSH